MEAIRYGVIYMNRNYFFDGNDWFAEDGERVLARIVPALGLALEETLAPKLPAMNVLELNRVAADVRRAGLLPLAEKAARLALAQSPGNTVVLATLCGVLHAQGRLEEALSETKCDSKPAALLTARASVLCELGRYEQAKSEIGQALAKIQKRSEKDFAFKVVALIKEKRPDLYR